MFDQLGLQGMGTELGTAAWAFIIIKFIIYPLIMRIPAVQRKVELRKVGNPGNPNSTGNLNKVPGHAQACREHGTKLTQFEGKIKNLCTSVNELKTLNRDDHKQIFAELNKKVDK